MKRIFATLSLMSVLSLASIAWAQSTTTDSVIEDKPTEVSSGTSIYDAQSISDLYKKYKKENEKRNADLPPHLKGDTLDTYQLKTFTVEADEIKGIQQLEEKLNPDRENRIRRLARINPDAANQMRVTIRDEETFFSGENDGGRTDGASTAATWSTQQVGSALSEALKSFKKLMGAIPEKENEGETR